jgi:hypothetical protein
MQEVRQMIADEVQAPLAASAHAPLVGVGRAGGGLRWSSRRPDAPLARRAGATGAPRVSPQLMHLGNSCMSVGLVAPREACTAMGLPMDPACLSPPRAPPDGRRGPERLEPGRSTADNGPPP